MWNILGLMVRRQVWERTESEIQMLHLEKMGEINFLTSVLKKPHFKISHHMECLAVGIRIEGP